MSDWKRAFGVGEMWPESLRALSEDGAASLALAAVAIPEQIAIARLAGLPPGLGLVVFVAASFGFFCFGANRFLSAGADSTIAPIFAGTLAAMAAASSAHYAALAAALALMVGFLVALAGALRLGWIARLLSVPIVTGFLAGIAIHIALSQLPAFLGAKDLSGDFSPAAVNPATVAIGFGVVAVIYVCQRIDLRIPGALIAVVLAAAAVQLPGFRDKGIQLLGAIAPAAFRPALPSVSVPELEQLLPTALIVSLVVIIQTATVSHAFKADHVDVDRDLAGVGLGGLISGLLGGFAANASPPRTAVASGSGATSRFAGLCAAVIVLAVLLLAPQLIAQVPQAALAGLLLVVAFRLFRLDMMRTIAEQSFSEFVLLVLTALAIIVMPVETGVGVGIALSLLYGVWAITQTEALLFEQIPGSTVWWPAGGDFAGESREGIVVVGFQAPLFFLNAETFRRSVNREVRAREPVRAIVLEASSLVELDFSGARTLLELIQYWNGRGVPFYVARLESLRAQRAFERFHLTPLLAHGRTFPSVAEAVRRIEADLPGKDQRR